MRGGERGGGVGGCGLFRSEIEVVGRCRGHKAEGGRGPMSRIKGPRKDEVGG